MIEEISFGTWLRQRRRLLDLTQQAFADQVGCARSTIRRIEADDLKPSKELAFILLGKLGIPESERPGWMQFARGLSDMPQKPAEKSDLVQRPTNFPAPLTMFIGREREQVTAINLLTKHRLVTLTGAGGVGKTRLALQVGQRLLNDYPNGVWFIALDSLSDSEQVPQTVAAVFDIRATADHPVAETLVNVLREKTALLILDNCEHMLDACAQLIISLLTNCPNLKVLVTSREGLGISGEALFAMPSLPIPELGADSLEELMKYESVKLFAERAGLASSSLRLTSENAQTIVNICRRVDGIPLAIELAAARVNILQVEEILKQLQHSFDLLTSDNRPTLSRQHTLQASMNWSWGLLTESEQRFMRQLSVYAGGWTLESAQAVWDDDVLNLTNALVKKSLIVVDQQAGRETRYRFHEIVRQYARAKLVVSGEEENIRNQHLKYFLSLSEQIEPGLIGPQQVEWYARTNAERDNIRVALEWADKTDVEAGLYLSSRLESFWSNFDFREGNHWLSKFLEKRESPAYPRARAKALSMYAGILLDRQQFDSLLLTAEECLGLYRSVGDRQGEVDGILWLAFAVSNVKEKIELNHQALELAQTLGDVWRQASALWQLGWWDDKHRFSYWKQGIKLARSSGNWHGLALCLGNMGSSLVLNDDIDSAQKYLDEADALFQQLNMKTARVTVLTAYGQIALIRGDFAKARAYLQECVKLGIEHGGRQDYLWSRTRLGYVAIREGNLTEARQLFYETAQEFQKDKFEIGVIFTVEGLAGLYIATGKPERAARLIGWADATREKISDTRPKLEQADVDKIIAACIAKIGLSAFEIAYDDGRGMTLDESVTLALDSKNE